MNACMGMTLPGTCCWNCEECQYQSSKPVKTTHAVIESCPVENHAEKHGLPEGLDGEPSTKSSRIVSTLSLHQSRIQVLTCISRLEYFPLRVVQILKVLGHGRILDLGMFVVKSSHIE